VDKSLKSVTRGQCDARSTVIFTVAAMRLVPNYTAWWQRHMCVNNLPKGERKGRELNLRPLVLHANALANPLHHQATP